MLLNHFEKMSNARINSDVEKKNGLDYLPWAMAWKQTKEIYPDAVYEIKRFDNNLPYVYDEKTGFMCFTSVTIENITHEMWLPVMDNRNKAMKQADMFNINKTIMRCLTKNLAMFGMGLALYTGEDLPEEEVVNEDYTNGFSNAFANVTSREDVDKIWNSKQKKLNTQNQLTIDACTELYNNKIKELETNG